MMPDDMPPVAGTYALLVFLDRARQVPVGRLGVCRFSPGWYVYLGSAHGPGGLRARVGRHLRRDKAIHWHIDALTAVAPVRQVWYVVAEKRLECRWAERIRQLPGSSMPVSGFGASDCACAAHLYALERGRTHEAWGALGHPVRFIVSG